MQDKTLFPADIYTVINKTILSDYDRRIIIAFYEPIIGPIASSLYFTLWQDLDTLDMMSRKLNHHHLMSNLRCKLSLVKNARESLESLGLLRTYYKKDEEATNNEYVYELYSPLTPSEFLNHPVFNIILFNNIGKEEYERLKILHQTPRFNTTKYVEITKQLDEVYEVKSDSSNIDYANRRTSHIKVNDKIDFDLILSTIPKNIVNEKAFNKKTRELINQLAFIYDIDTLKMAEIIRNVLNECNMIDKKALRLATRKMYQVNNNRLPSIVYRVQPDYLKAPEGDNSMKGKIVAVFDNVSPYDFLKQKNKGVKPISNDLKLIEKLMIDLEMKPGVVNVLIDYVLRINKNRLSAAYTEKIASTWMRAGITTVKEAMNYAEKEYKKIGSYTQNKNVKVTAKKPIWMKETVEKKEVSKEEEEELNNLLKEFK